ncbi:VTT domain-containing protein [Maribellus sp. YY47]|uniref:YqaA family protein n=1 Tax=Maribellus sp. YY47 TaxID=2929486 RepID=UPI0020011BBD|nr:VTT domain-containing protein [Maribellus sp. YY47]MCK3683219.1 VTT domain-containing protein [Maribellus sp. YY47]
MIKNMLFSLTPKRLAILNRYYRITRFYSFLKSTAYKGGTVTAIFVLILISLEIFLLDFNLLLNNLVTVYSPKIIYSVFLLSETILGLLPPEVFIAWASKIETPWGSLFILASLSYLGGIIAYFVGTRLSMIPYIKNRIETKLQKHIINLRKWGGLFVFLGAVSPIPHSIVSLASGLIKYNFKNYLLWALFRYMRFILYAFVIFGIF